MQKIVLLGGVVGREGGRFDGGGIGVSGNVNGRLTQTSLRIYNIIILCIKNDGGLYATKCA